MRKFIAALSIAFAIAGTTVVGASPASAISGCSVFLISTDTVGARCTSSAGWGRQVMAVGECRRDLTRPHDVYGAWVNVGQTSIARCGAGYYATPAIYLLRS